MTAIRDETPDVSHDIVRRLVDTQFPAWSGLPLTRFHGEGTDNAIYRLGADFCVRLPRVSWAAGTARREQHILTVCPSLPLEVPRPLGLGWPAEGYPWNWSVLNWIPGQAIGMRQLTGEDAETLADAILRIRAIPPEPAYMFGPGNNNRGSPLIERDTPFRRAADTLADEFEVADLISVWDLALAADQTNAPIYLHGDIHGGNLLDYEGRLTAVIDWGLAGVGDGACDLSAAWCLFKTEERKRFHTALNATEAEQLRGAGWALSIACLFVAHYRQYPEVSCDMSRRTIRQILAALS